MNELNIKYRIIILFIFVLDMEIAFSINGKPYKGNDLIKLWQIIIIRSKFYALRVNLGILS